MLPTYYGYFFFAILHFARSSVGLSISLEKFNQRSKIGQAIYVRKTFRNPGVENTIDLIDVPEFVSFAIIQAHAQERYFAFYQTNSRNCFGTKCILRGSNLGLVTVFDKSRTAQLGVFTEEKEPLDVLISVVAYDENAPIPGGCDMEFKSATPALQTLQYTDATVTLDAQLALAPLSSKLPCGSPSLKLQHYRMFLPERDFEQETYFDAIQKMTTVQDILDNGHEILPALSTSSARRVFSAYPGTGSVYAMIATYGNYSSAYVPVVSYACSPLSDPSSCGNHNRITVQTICVITFIVGFVVTLIGHKYPELEVVFLGAIFISTTTFLVLSAVGYFQTSAVLGIVMLLSVLAGILCLLLSYCTETPRKFLAPLTLGFFVASTIYHLSAGDSPLFENDLSFWHIFLGIMLLVSIVLGLLPFDSNNVCCAILGAYTIILSIDTASGSYLKYIVINTVRRATVSGFNVAVMRPPYQSTDKILVFLLFIIALIGIFVRARPSHQNPSKKLACSVDMQTVVTPCSTVKIEPEPVVEKY